MQRRWDLKRIRGEKYLKRTALPRRGSGQTHSAVGYGASASFVENARCALPAGLRGAGWRDMGGNESTRYVETFSKENILRVKARRRMGECSESLAVAQALSKLQVHFGELPTLA